MTPPPHPTLGPHVEYLARQLMARRTKVLALREPALRQRLLAHRPARARVEVYVPPVGQSQPSELSWGTSGAGQAQHPASRVNAVWARPDSVSQSSGEPLVVSATTWSKRGGVLSQAGPTVERLPAATQDRLRPALGHEVADVMVHTGEAATTLARGHGTDAITLGKDIYWADHPPATDRAGDAELLHHEVWHAVQSTRPGTSWRRSTPAGREAEERQAYAQAVDRPIGLSPTVEYTGVPFGYTPTRPQPGPPQRWSRAADVPGAADVPAAPAQQPMPGVREPEPPAPGQTTPPARVTSPEQMYHEVLRQLRRDRERGA